MHSPIVQSDTIEMSVQSLGHHQHVMLDICDTDIRTAASQV